MNKEKKTTRLMEVHLKGKHYCQFGKDIKEDLVEEGVDRVRVRYLWNMEPYLSFFKSGSMVDINKEGERVYAIESSSRGKGIRVTDEEFILRIVDEFNLKYNETSTVNLERITTPESDSIIEYKMFVVKISAQAKELAGTEFKATTGTTNEPNATDKTLMYNVDQFEIAKRMEENDRKIQQAKQELLEEMEKLKKGTPITEIWVKYLKCDNGFVMKDDSGVEKVKEDTSYDNFSLIHEIGRTVVEEIKNLTETDLIIDYGLPLGWKIEMRLSPIYKPEEFFREGGAE